MTWPRFGLSLARIDPWDPCRLTMLTPAVLLLLSLLIALALRPLTGETAPPVFLLALVTATAALILILREAVARRLAGRRPKPGPAWVVIDGSNVMFWQGEVPRLATVAAVVGEATRAGLKPLVWFDANAGYRVANRYMGARALSRALGLPARQVRIAPSGKPADPLLLADAARLGTGVITNDRYRDWAGDYPAVRVPGVLVPGQVTDGVARLDWAA